MHDKIIKILKKGEKSTSEIARLIKRNYYDTLDFLNQLAIQHKVENIQMNKFNFWRIKHGKSINK